MGESPLAARMQALAATWQQWAQLGGELRTEDWQLPTPDTTPAASQVVAAEATALS